MSTTEKLYQTALNPLLIEPSRRLPDEIAVIGAGTIGPDIGYYLKSAMPDIKLYLVDVVEKPLQPIRILSASSWSMTSTGLR